MLKTVSIDGPDFSGKSTLCKIVKGMLESAGLKVCIRNHPTTETEAGIRARSLVIQSAAKAKNCRSDVRRFPPHVRPCC